MRNKILKNYHVLIVCILKNLIQKYFFKIKFDKIQWKKRIKFNKKKFNLKNHFYNKKIFIEENKKLIINLLIRQQIIKQVY